MADSEIKDSPEDAVNLYDEEFNKLILIINEIYKGVDRNENNALRAFNLFKIIYARDQIKCCIDAVKVVRVEILNEIKKGKSLDAVLRAYRFQIIASHTSKIQSKPALFLQNIYNDAIQHSIGAKGKASKYPEIIRLHLARILNMVENDPDLIIEIQNLEKSLNVKSNGTASVPTPDATIDLSGVPPQFRSMVQMAMPYKDVLTSLGSKVMSPAVMSAFQSGDFQKAAKAFGKDVMNDPTARSQIGDIKKMVDPMIKKGAQAFAKNGVQIPGFTNPDEVNVDTVLQKATEAMETEEKELPMNDIVQTLIGTLMNPDETPPADDIKAITDEKSE